MLNRCWGLSHVDEEEVFSCGRCLGTTHLMDGVLREPLVANFLWVSFSCRIGGGVS